MIFETITGALPFKGSSIADLLRAMSQGCPTVPGGSVENLMLNCVLQKCLALERTERFQTATELRSELLPVLRSFARE
jgi:serine/threonine protein kinase